MPRRQRSRASDEPSGEDPAWWVPSAGTDTDDPDVLRALVGRIDPTRPIGPLSLRFRTRRPYVLVAVAVTALLCGAGAALVVGGSGKPVAAANASAPGPAPSSSPAGSSRGAEPDPDVLHGQYVVRAPAGGYQTIDEQTGQVTAVSSTSITLRSIDGFTERYSVGKSTIVDSGRDKFSSVKVGDQASLEAVVRGSTAIVTTIDDLTILEHRGSALDSGHGLRPQPVTVVASQRRPAKDGAPGGRGAAATLDALTPEASLSAASL